MASVVMVTIFLSCGQVESLCVEFTAYIVVSCLSLADMTFPFEREALLLVIKLAGFAISVVATTNIGGCRSSCEDYGGYL